MKTFTPLHLILIIFLLSSQVSLAQNGNNEFESMRLDCMITNSSADTLVDKLKGSDNELFDFLKNLVNDKNNGLTADAGLNNILVNLKAELKSTLLGIEKKENKALMLVYRNLVNVKQEGSDFVTFKADFSSLNTKIFHSKKEDGSFSNYLLATKTFYIILIDLSKEYFLSKPADIDQKLSATTVKISYRTNRFKQSFADLSKVWKTMNADATNGLQLTIIKVEPSRIKDPCDILLSNKSFKEELSITIHERNVATFQVGVTNSKINVQNISISGTDLLVKPDDNQSTNWKSNAYALLELHIPRDIDNFRPLWKSIISAQQGYKPSFGTWLFENTIYRIGLYGGMKISGDPLSSLYSGFNYAISREVAINFGWVWTNQYANQVIDIGAVTSLDDVLKYAKRSYAKPKFSIGFSFAPSAFSTALGLKSKSAETGSNQ